MKEKPSLSLADAAAMAAKQLLAERTAAGYWAGELASSALSTATAVSALLTVLREQYKNPGSTLYDNESLLQLAKGGLKWLVQHINPDGGWGDTVQSFSNISTTTLCYAAFRMGQNAGLEPALPFERVENWLADRAGGLEPHQLAAAIVKRYGKDRTFSIPILTACAIAGVLGDGKEAWRHVMPLPFELAAFPHRFFAALRLPVVSYALPALIAIGQTQHHHRPSRNPVVRLFRSMAKSRTLKKLESIHPSSGGFLEATPLTSFVAMSLAAMGLFDHPVVKNSVRFLRESVRTDGCWPIDTNLATWATTLSVNAAGDCGMALLTAEERSKLTDWLMQQQYRETHPYTMAAPGGWAWTDLTGGVPDADDTAGALLALHRLNSESSATVKSAAMGVEWLLNLQNRDGGIPTFCRGWGALPFDRSGADLTAHAIRAWLVWFPRMENGQKTRVFRAVERAVQFLGRCQKPNGSWIPLWFGNQHEPREENPLYGTSRVVLALADCSKKEIAGVSELLAKGIQWIMDAQSEDGGWSGFKGGPNSIEETALALEALGAVLEWDSKSAEMTANSVERGLSWLRLKIESGSWTQPSPIGFYFANLWYFEKLYPQIYTVAALNRCLAATALKNV